MNIAILNSTLVNSAKNQLLGEVSNKAKQTIFSKLEELNNELNILQEKNKKIQKEYSSKIKNIQSSNTLSKEEKDKNIKELQEYQKKEISTIDEQIDKLTNEIEDLPNNILSLAKKEIKKINGKIEKNIIKGKVNEVKSDSLRLKQILKNNKKSLSSIITNQLSGVLLKVISQNGKIEKLINDTNEVIDNTNTDDKVIQAINLKNSAIAIINNQESKILSLQNTLKDISTVIQIFSLVLTILSTLPIPVSTPPGVGMPLNVITNISKLIEKLNNLINELVTILAIIIPLTEKVINDLEEYKSKLHDINSILDDKINKSSDIYNSIRIDLSNFKFEEYKGFKFALKEEENLGAHKKVTFRGIKRKYAVAINKDGVEVLKSDYSFTLEPNDLIEQLKLIIDTKGITS